MSSGGGPNSEIAKLSIGLEATGADATTQKLKSVEQQAKQTAAAVQSSSIVGPGYSGGSSSISMPGSMPGGSAAAVASSPAVAATKAVADNTEKTAKRVAAAAVAQENFTKAARDATKPIEFVQSMVGRITAGLSLAGVAIAGVWSLITAESRKAEEASKRMLETSEKAFRLHQEIFSNQKDSLDRTLEKFDEMTTIEESLYTRRDQMAKLEEVRARHRVERAKIIQDAEDKEALKGAQERAKLFDDELKKTEAAESAARIEGMSEEEKVIDSLAQKREEINRRIAATTDQYVVDLLNRQLAAAETLAQKQLAALAVKAQKEQEAALERARSEREQAEQAARAFSDAFSREAKTASDSIRDAFRDANTTNYLRDAAQSLRAILQKRKL